MFRRLILLVFLISNLSAHPVIFKNGKVFWLTQNTTYNDLRFGISKTSNWYIGFRLLEDRKEEKQQDRLTRDDVKNYFYKFV